MILILVCDGLRPDLIRSETTPFLFRMSRRGVVCSHSHAAFPTATRINSASLASGCYPGRHGIVDNELYVPGVDATQVISCADWRSLQAMADLEGERLISVPTVGEMLRAAGKQMAAAGSGSPGTTYLIDPTLSGPVVNWALAWPGDTQREVERRFGGMLPTDSDSSERNSFVFRVVQEYLMPAHQPDLLTIWVTEPDHIQHEHGLESPQTLGMLREIDAQIEALVESIAESVGEENLTCFLLSDHGFSTIASRVDPDQELAAAGFSSSGGEIGQRADVLRASNSLYLSDAALKRVPELVEFLASRTWIDAVFVRDDLMYRCPGALPQSAAFGTHRRSAEIMFSYAWSDTPNQHGVCGSVTHPASIAAIHGSSSPYTINNTLVAWGAGIKEGVNSDVPCGIVDVTPTVLHLLGVEVPSGMDGRVLTEITRLGPDPRELAVTHSTRSVTYPASAGGRRQVLSYSHVQGHTYLDQAEILEL